MRLAFPEFTARAHLIERQQGYLRFLEDTPMARYERSQVFNTIALAGLAAVNYMTPAHAQSNCYRCFWYYNYGSPYLGCGAFQHGLGWANGFTSCYATPDSCILGGTTCGMTGGGGSSV